MNETNATTTEQAEMVTFDYTTKCGMELDFSVDQWNPDEESHGEYVAAINETEGWRLKMHEESCPDCTPSDENKLRHYMRRHGLDSSDLREMETGQWFAMLSDTVSYSLSPSGYIDKWERGHNTDMGMWNA